MTKLIEEYSKFNLNKQLALYILENAKHGLLMEGLHESVDLYLPTMDGSDSAHAGNFDFEDWYQLMPLVVEHGISRLDLANSVDHIAYREISLHDNIVARTDEVRNRSPQRALAECLLRVLIDKKGKI